jgi:cation transport ATPase
MVQQARQGLELEDLRASRWSALVILFLALSAGIFWHERTPGYAQALLASGTVALFASVCNVGLLLHGLRRGLVQGWMQRGYLLSNADSVKQLAAVRSVECDASRCGEGSLLKAVSLDILDDRLAPSALCDFICALVGRAEDPILVAVAEYCRRHGKTPSVERVVDLREYLGRGICGAVHGVELSVGSEDFLVERGIMIQPSDGVAPTLGEHLVMIAIDDDVVARVHVIDNQAAVVTADLPMTWNGDVHISVAPGVARSLENETLLVRGNESDLLGQMANCDMTFFDPSEGVIRRLRRWSSSLWIVEPMCAQWIGCGC